MNPSSIATALVAAAAFLKKPITEVSTEAIKDAYTGVKSYLLRKFGPESPATKALEMATEKPESAARKSLLVEELEASGLDGDSELLRLVEQLKSRLGAGAPSVSAPVRVVGDRNIVQVAGRDLITTHKHVQKNIITPDEHHLSPEQAEAVRHMIGETARRFSDRGMPNFAAVHCLLQRRYAVHSYLLIPRDQFEDAINFLKQRRAIYRSRMRRSDPVAYRNDLFRLIFAAADKLEWSPSQVFEYVTKTLRASLPIASLKDLGPIQLKTVERSIKCEVSRRSEPN